MSTHKVLFGFHAVGVRLKTAPDSVVEVYFEASRRDARMRQFIARAKEAGVRLIEADGLRLSKLAGSHGHQGVAALVEPVAQARSLDELLDELKGPPLLLVLDGITDPHIIRQHRVWWQIQQLVKIQLCCGLKDQAEI